MNFSEIFSKALTIGEKMLCSGAEVSRVEDSIIRICTSYGAQRVDVFSITSSIVASAEYEGKTYTQTRRITSYKTDLALLDSLNDLSRQICKTTPDVEYINNRLEAVTSKAGYSFLLRMLAWGTTSGSFTVFFGGTLRDGIVSFIIGMLLMFCAGFVEKRGFNKVFSNIVSSFFISILAFFSVYAGLGLSSDKIIIGSIMPLIPGLSLTNAIRDLISGDIMSGVLRFCEACLVALAIAGGYFIAVVFSGGAAL